MDKIKNIFKITNIVAIAVAIIILALIWVLITPYNKPIDATPVWEDMGRIATQIQNVLHSEEAISKTDIYLSRELKIGSDPIEYEFGIDDLGQVDAYFTYRNHVFAGGSGIITDLTWKSGDDRIDCTWDQIKNGAHLVVTKNSHRTCNDFDMEDYRVVNLTIEAPECGNTIEFEGRYPIDSSDTTGC